MTITTPPPGLGGLWNPDREDIRRGLASRHPLCGELYQQVVEALGPRPVKAAALVVAAHALRELINMLPAYLSDVELPKPVPDKASRQELVTQWKDADIVLGGDTGQIPIPTALARAIERFVADQEQITENQRARRAALVLGTNRPTDDATVRLVRRAVDTIERYRHPRGDTSLWSASGATEFLEDLEVIERALQSRIGDFFAVTERLTLLLQSANSFEEEKPNKWTEPTREQVEEVLSRLADKQHRRVFYERLKNPNWIEPLDGHHVFADPPLETVDEAGYAVWSPWPQGDYLVASAGQVPARVATILLRVIPQNAARNVQSVMVKAATRMPASQAKRLVGLIDGHTTHPLEPDIGFDAVEVIERLVEARETKAAKRLTNTLLRPRPAPRDSHIGRRSVTAGIETHWYAEALQRVLRAWPNDGLFTQTVIWLEEEQRASGTYDAAKSHDSSFISRPAIDDHPQNRRSSDIEDSLTDAVRDQAVKALEEGMPARDLMPRLLRGSVPLLERIGLYAVSRAADRSGEASSLATEILLSADKIGSRSLHREYCQLAAATLPLLDDNQFAEWAGLIQTGPELDEAQRLSIIERDPSISPEEAIANYIEAWQHRQLSAVGRDALRGETLERLLEFDHRRGEFPHADFLAWHSTYWESEEPSSVDGDKFLALPANEVLRVLSDWEPDPETFGPSPTDRLAMAFGTVTGQRAAEFSALTPDIMALGEPWISRFLGGIREAIGADQSIDWDTFLKHAGDFEITLGSEDSSRLSYLRREVCVIVERGAAHKTSPIPALLAETAMSLIHPYLDDTNPSRTAEGGGSGWSDPLTESLNTVRPSAIRAAVRLAWRYRDTTDVAPRLSSTTLARLSGRLTPVRDPSLATAAAFGELFGILVELAPEWIESHRPYLLSPDEFGDVVATTALLSYRTSQKLIEQLDESIRSMIDRTAAGEIVISGWEYAGHSPMERIGFHLMLLVLWGTYNPETPLVAYFFGQAPVGIRAEALGQVGAMLRKPSEPIPVDVRNRAKELWDARSALVESGAIEPEELAKFYTWVESEAFEYGWWIPRLKNSLGYSNSEVRGYLGEQLAEASKEYPCDVIEIFSLLLGKDHRGFGRYELIESCPGVIARALRSGDPLAEQQGLELRDRLGRQGYLDIATLVANFKESESN